MTKFDRADHDKIQAAVFDLTRETIDAGKDRAVFHISHLFQALKFSRMSRNAFPAALMDVPSGTDFCKMFGDWIIAEVGDDQYVLIKLGERENPWYDAEEFYKKNYRVAAPVRKKPNVVKIDLPEGMTPEQAREAVRVAGVYNQQAKAQQ
uniref:Uncharacterized protein n=1 Tax=Pseudomonas phage HRDY3 TaxID=3236930 RepID=A0AB39CEG1_9VIRU